MKILIKILLNIAAATVLAFAGTMASAEQIVIRLSYVTSPTGHPKGEAAEAFAARVNEEMAGLVRVDTFPNSTLYNDNDVLDAMILGDVEMAAPSLSKLEPYTKTFRVFDLPFVFENTAALDAFQASETGQEMLSSLEDFGLLGLGFWRNGMKQFSANRPLLDPSDAVGLRFRIQSSDVLAAMVEALGASGQKMAFAEVFGALQTRTVDGQENTWSNIYTKKFYTVQDGVTASNHGILDYIVVANAAFWNDLPADIRAQLETIFAEVTAEQNAKAQQINMNARDAIIAEGHEVRQLTAEQRAAWQATMQPVYDQFVGEIGQDVLDAAIASNG